MAKCLVVKLAESVNDNSLMKFGFLRIKYTVSDADERNDTYIDIKTNGCEYILIDGVKRNLWHGGISYYMYDSGVGEHIIEIENKYLITELNFNSMHDIPIELLCTEELSMCDSITTIDEGFNMDIADYAYMKRYDFYVRRCRGYGKVEDYTERMRSIGIKEGKFRIGSYNLGNVTLGGLLVQMPKGTITIDWDANYEWTTTYDSYTTEGVFGPIFEVWVNGKMPQSEIDKRTAEGGMWYGITVVKRSV